MTEHEPLTQGSGAETTCSGWQSTKHSLGVVEHEPRSEQFAQNDVAWSHNQEWALDKWLKHSSKHSNYMVDKEPLARLSLHTIKDSFNFKAGRHRARSSS